MFTFGSGLLFLNPVGGNLTSNPTPFAPLTLQNISVEISQDLKELKGANKIADDIAPGDMKITGKFAYGNQNVDLINNIFFGDTRSTGIKQIQPNEAHSVPSTGPYTVTVTQSATFLTDLGCNYQGNGLALLRVPSAPTAGQYSVSSGVYTFASADSGLGVRVSYVWNSTSTGRTVQVNNQLMGYGPIFELWLADPYQSVAGLNNGIHLYACRASKVSKALKQGDYSIPEIDYQAFSNSAGQIGEFFQVAN